jgi:hypothetical protein
MAVQQIAGAVIQAADDVPAEGCPIGNSGILRGNTA